MAKIKKLEKDVRSAETDNVKLEKTLHQADADRNKLINEHKEVQENQKRADNRLKLINNSIAELQITCKNLEQQSAKAQGEFDRNSALLNQEL
jgi:chromosome segregation ATPase